MSRRIDPKLRADVIALVAAGDGVERRRMADMTDDDLIIHAKRKAEKKRFENAN